MNVNPMAIMKLKGLVDGFRTRHPKLIMFFKDAGHRIDTDAVLELSVTSPNGEKIRTNFRVTPEDKELISAISELVASGQQ